MITIQIIEKEVIIFSHEVVNLDKIKEGEKFVFIYPNEMTSKPYSLIQKGATESYCCSMEEVFSHLPPHGDIFLNDTKVKKIIL